MDLDEDQDQLDKDQDQFISVWMAVTCKYITHYWKTSWNYIELWCQMEHEMRIWTENVNYYL